jgi:hypothetical protein
MTAILELPAYDIRIELWGDVDANGVYDGGELHSSLHDGEMEGDEEIRAAVDAIEALVLGHAVAGVNVVSPAYLEGLESAVQGLFNNLG